MWKPTLRQQEMIADMSLGGMSSERIASALGISPEVFTAWGSRLRAARALDPQAVDRLLYPPKPVAVQPPPPQREPRIVAERIFEEFSEAAE
jgi:transposase-like protein